MMHALSKKPWVQGLLNTRLLVVLFLGFSSGLPLALTGSTLEAWFAKADKSYLEIGFITLVGTPYVFKFLWAPFIDRYVWPFLGPRRGWMIVTQCTLLAAIMCMSLFDPINTPLLLAALAVTIAFVSATQDIAVDAYRAEILLPEERGMGAAFSVSAYRIAMLVSTGIALIIADQIGFEKTYLIMASLMGVGIITTCLAREPVHEARRPTSLQEAVIGPLVEFLARPQAIALLLVVIFYKFGDAFIAKMTTAFLIKGLDFSLTEIGTVTKMGGIFATILGTVMAGYWMTRWSLVKSLVVFGLFQAFSNCLFLWLAHVGHSFPVMATTILVENLCGGMGTAAFIALLIALCHHRYTAFQFALLSALSAVGREFLGPLAGYMVETWGWTTFFLTTFIMSFPGLMFVWWARDSLNGYTPPTKEQVAEMQEA